MGVGECGPVLPPALATEVLHHVHWHKRHCPVLVHLLDIQLLRRGMLLTGLRWLLRLRRRRLLQQLPLHRREAAGTSTRRHEEAGDATHVGQTPCRGQSSDQRRARTAAVRRLHHRGAGIRVPASAAALRAEGVKVVGGLRGAGHRRRRHRLLLLLWLMLLLQQRQWWRCRASGWRLRRRGAGLRHSCNGEERAGRLQCGRGVCDGASTTVARRQKRCSL